jgi:glycosyltransferase involved in cell wall biosynthesis
MRIFYDPIVFAHKCGGVSKIFAEIMKRRTKSGYFLSLIFSENMHIKEYGLKKTIKLFGSYYRGKSLVYEAANLLFAIFDLVFRKYDIYHLTTFHKYLLPFAHRKSKIVVTIHDLVPFIVPELSNNKASKDYKHKYEHELALLADKIITVSENTKKDIIKTWNIAKEKIVVIYNGVDVSEIELPQERFITQKYILYVGQRGSQKNFENFIEAFIKIKNTCKDVFIVCTGIPFRNYEIEYLKEKDVYEKIIKVEVSDIDLKRLYRDAEMFIYPSFYEGFGIPLLEAMVQGCPVTCSNRSCFPEIAEDAALYFDPYSIDDIAEKMEKILTDKNLRKYLVEKGKNRSKFFSWDKTAEGYINVYKSVL